MELKERQAAALDRMEDKNARLLADSEQQHDSETAQITHRHETALELMQHTQAVQLEAVVRQHERYVEVLAHELSKIRLQECTRVAAAARDRHVRARAGSGGLSEGKGTYRDRA